MRFWVEKRRRLLIDPERSRPELLFNEAALRLLSSVSPRILDTLWGSASGRLRLVFGHWALSLAGFFAEVTPA